MPNGILMKQYLPLWVRKVVKSFDKAVITICQNPEFASSFENTVSPDKWASVSSTIGKGCTSLWTFVLSVLRSTHTLTAPFFLGTTTMPTHHGVGWSTYEITSKIPFCLALSVLCSIMAMAHVKEYSYSYGKCLSFWLVLNMVLLTKVAQTFKQQRKL